MTRIATLMICAALAACSRAPSASENIAPNQATDSVPTVAPTPAGSGASIEAYGKLHTGMTIADAQSIIGVPGEEMSSSEFGGQTMKMMVWRASDGVGNITATFNNGRLLSKAQLGLTAQ